jgi:hypothetical protein
LEDYLLRFPSGKFSELAQFRLNRLLAQREAAVRIAIANNILRPSSSKDADFKYEKAASTGL